MNDHINEVLRDSQVYIIRITNEICQHDAIISRKTTSNEKFSRVIECLNYL